MEKYGLSPLDPLGCALGNCLGLRPYFTCVSCVLSYYGYSIINCDADVGQVLATIPLLTVAAQILESISS